MLDAYFSGTKLTWLFRNNSSLRARAERGELAFGTVDTWLIWKLTGGAAHLTDHTNASRTLLYNIDAREWSSELCDLLEVPPQILPQVRSSAAIYGQVVAEEFPCRNIPIAGLAGDQQAALFGQGCVNPGDAKNTYGTGCFLMTNVGGERHPSTHGLLETLAVGSDLSPCYALEGSVFIAGALIQWLRDGLQILEHAGQSEELALQAADDHGVHVVPAFVGLGAPYWDMEARGAITGLTRGSGRPEIIRAALEAIAFQTRDLVHAMEADSGRKLHELRVDGGATANGFLMQFQADLLGIPVDRPVVAETTAAGAAFLAGLTIGLYDGIKSLQRLRRSDRLFHPAIDRQRADELYRGWQGAVARVRLRP